MHCADVAHKQTATTVEQENAMQNDDQWSSDRDNARDLEREPFNAHRRQRIPLTTYGTLRQTHEDALEARDHEVRS